MSRELDNMGTAATAAVGFDMGVGKKVLVGKECDFCKGQKRGSPPHGGLLMGVAHSTYTRTGLTDAACA